MDGGRVAVRGAETSSPGQMAADWTPQRLSQPPPPETIHQHKVLTFYLAHAE